MSDWDEVEIEKPTEDLGPRRPGLLPVGIVGALLLIGIGFYFFYWKNRTAPEPSPTAETLSAPEPVEVIEEAEAPIELPPLGESDALLRELVAKLSSHPRWASWLVQRDLIRRFTIIVDNIAEGVSPRAHLLFLEPSEEFRVVEREGGTFIDPATYDRYNLVGEVFASLDTAGSAKLYRDFKPLIEEAYQELGRPARSFDQRLALAMQQLRETPVSEGPVEVIPRIKSYGFADPELESLTEAQKHFFRMGPRNVRRIQSKLRELDPLLTRR